MNLGFLMIFIFLVAPFFLIIIPLEYYFHNGAIRWRLLNDNFDKFSHLIWKIHDCCLDYHLKYGETNHTRFFVVDYDYDKSYKNYEKLSVKQLMNLTNEVILMFCIELNGTDEHKKQFEELYYAKLV